MNRNSVFALIFVGLLALSPAAGLAGATAAPDGGTDTENISLSDGVVNPNTDVEFDKRGNVDPNLKEAEGTQEVVLRFDEIDRTSLQGVSGDAAISQLKTHAAASQQNLLRFAKQSSGVEVVNRLWIANAVLVEVDISQVSIEKLTSIKGVESAHANFKLSVPETKRGASSEGATSANYDTTYGLDQINATEVWDEYNTMGEGIGVAVLDTGVDPDHPDIDIQPDNFVEATEEGVENVDPYDSAYHGTHTSGTVVGGNASGEYIGVAPEATLYHGLVIPGGGGSFAQVAVGMEWAAEEEGVDVISMSLGSEGYSPQMIEPVQNIEAAGNILVASAGNSYAGSSGSPGNVYESVAAGASNEAGGIADFSSGEEIDTSADWGSDAPEDWPEQYIVPNYAAPGVDVKSADSGGGYQELSGTSMSAPHISGAVALMLSASGDLDQTTVEEALTETAWAPGEDPDPTRYGDGIIDIKGATDMVALEQGINGTVTAADGSGPIEGATVTTDQGFQSQTNAAGEYTVLAEPGTVNVTAEAFGYGASTSEVEVENGTYTTQNLSLDPALGVEQTEGQADAIMGGESVSAAFSAVNADSVTVNLTGDYSADNSTLYVNSEMASFGDAVSLAEDGTVNVTVMTASGTSGDISLEHTFEGENDSETFTTGPTDVFEELTNVAVVHTGDYGGSVQTALQDELSGQYLVDTVTSADAAGVAGDYDIFVVQNMEEDDAQGFVDATNTPETGVVYLDNWGSDSNAIPAKSAVTGEPASTEDGYSGSMNPHFVNVDGDNPLFEGVDTSDDVEIHTGTFSDHSWFSGSSGTVLADVTDKSSSVDGAGIAYYEDTNTVLASSLGRESFVENGDFTDAADTILGNTVEYTNAKAPTIVGDVVAMNATADPGSETTVTVKTTAPNVAGYELNLSYNASKVQVTEVIGMEMGDPVTNINNEEGWVKVAQTRTEGTDEPNLYKVKFDVSMVDRDDWTSVEFVDTHQLVYPNGTEMYTHWDDGTINVANLAGDVNGDDTVTISDAQMVQQYIVGNPIEGPIDEGAADVNNDGVVTSADVTAILQIVVGNENPSDYDESSSSQLAAQPGTAAPLAA